LADVYTYGTSHQPSRRGDGKASNGDMRPDREKKHLKIKNHQAMKILLAITIILTACHHEPPRQKMICFEINKTWSNGKDSGVFTQTCLDSADLIQGRPPHLLVVSKQEWDSLRQLYIRSIRAQ
jgi:hypothetical protein